MDERRDSSSAGTERAGATRRAFTLIEMTIVVLMIAILAAIAIPRFTGNERRRFELVVEQVADLLTMYAQREHLSKRPVGLDYRGGRLVIVEMEGVTNDDETLDTDWVIDRFVKPVELESVVGDGTFAVWADGEMIFLGERPLSHQPGQNRPEIEMYLQANGGEHEATLVLAPHAVAPVRRGLPGKPGMRGGAVVSRESLDLDQLGMSREDW